MDRSQLVHGGSLLQLAERAGGFAEGPMVLPPQRGGAYAEGMSIPADVLQRTGYRLPTEAEWEYACRAGAVTSRYYGNSIDLIDAYAWYQANSNEHAWPCGSLLPNDLGLFDMLGNAIEWCHDRGVVARERTKGLYRDNIYYIEYIKNDARALRGGSFHFLPEFVHSTYANHIPASQSNIYYGFRPYRTCP